MDKRIGFHPQVVLNKAPLKGGDIIPHFVHGFGVSIIGIDRSLVDRVDPPPGARLVDRADLTLGQCKQLFDEREIFKVKLQVPVVDPTAFATLFRELVLALVPRKILKTRCAIYGLLANAFGVGLA